MLTGNLERATLEALTYSDIFEYPLRLDELHRYLPLSANADELLGALNALNGQVGKRDGYYFLAERHDLVDMRKRRAERSSKLLPYAIQYGRVLGTLPYIRMVALTGSLAVMNISEGVDFDYMLVTSPGRLWTARAFALAFNRLVRSLGHTICPNLIVSENALGWPLHDLYSARELCQMVPISGLDVYQRLMTVNLWARDFLPNAFLDSKNLKTLRELNTFPKHLLEFFLRGKLGDRIEQWEMNRKIARFSKQQGFGEETVFTAEVCQGNFHHHREHTLQEFERKLSGRDPQRCRRIIPEGHRLEH